MSISGFAVEMWRFLTIVLALASIAAADTTSCHKAFRLTPESEDQLETLLELDNDVEGYSYWKSPSSVLNAADLMVAPEKLEEFLQLVTARSIQYEPFIENVEALLESEAPANIPRTKCTCIRNLRNSTFFIITSTDPAIRKIAEAHDWYIFPVVNPDGYAYTHVNPKLVDHRLWRKNRSLNQNSNSSSSCYGTDLNRNWDYKWMIIGASSDLCSEAYAGKTPFSEIETKTIAKYISSISTKLYSYIAFHSYSQFLMFPYGHTESHLDNYDQEYAISKKAAEALSRRYGTSYKIGNIGQLVGGASGGSIDWVKAKFKLPLTFVYELRDTGKNGFVLPPNQIIPNGEEVMDSLVALFGEAKKYRLSSQSRQSSQ